MKIKLKNGYDGSMDKNRLQIKGKDIPLVNLIKDTEILLVLGVKINMQNNLTEYLCLTEIHQIPEYYPAEYFDLIDESLSKFWVIRKFDEFLFISFPEWMDFFRGIPNVFKIVKEEIEEIEMSIEEFNKIDTYLYFNEILMREYLYTEKIIQFKD